MTTSDLATAAALGSASAALIGLILLIQNSITAWQQSRRDAARLVVLLSERWEELREDWHTALMQARGVDSFYLDVDQRTRDEYAEKLRQLQEASASTMGLTVGEGSEWARATAETMSWLAEQLGVPPDDFVAEDHIGRLLSDPTLRHVYKEFERRADGALELLVAEIKPTYDIQVRAHADLGPYRVSTRRVLRFLAEVSGHILRGLVSAESIYEAFGPEIARNGGSIRQLLGEHEESWARVQPGLALRVLILIDLMWAQGARLGELATQPSAANAAEHKKKHKTGGRNKRRAFELANSLGPRRNAHRIRRLLKHAERPAEPLRWEELDISG